MEKIFCGNGTLKEFPNGGKLINAFVNMDVMNQAMQEFGFKSQRNESTLKVKIVPVRDKPGKYYLEVDTWKPQQQDNQQS